jgi:site-specific DNA-methyltransferase (cytosine-N4-specific)
MVLEFGRDIRVYETRRGVQLCADSRAVLRTVPADSVDLIITSPPFALLRQKSYGNESQSEYVSWLGEFGEAALRVLKPTGSFVLDLGGAYERGRPIRSLYNFRVLLDWCDRIGYRLAEEFFWYNPAKLPSPIEWVNKRKLRAKDAVNTVWWFSKTDNPKADITKVLVPYSERMETLLKDPDKFYTPKERPSGHDIARGFGKRNAGAIPSNLLQIPNTDSNSHYLRTCKMLARDSHPARYPSDLPRFFINLLTDPDELVMDIFAGSNTTGHVAEELGRRWISIESDRQFAVLSAIRFMTAWDDRSIQAAVTELEEGRVIDLEAGLSLDPTTETPRPVGSLQSRLFE